MSTVTILPTGLVLVLLMVVVLCISGQAHAFGAGNIPETSLLDGHLWRHGDIADLLINLPMSFITNRPFKVMDVKVIYFGNWLRDYSQLLDVGGMTKIPEDILRSIVSGIVASLRVVRTHVTVKVSVLGLHGAWLCNRRV